MFSKLYKDLQLEILSYMSIQELSRKCRTVSKEIKYLSVKTFQHIVDKSEPNIKIIIVYDYKTKQRKEIEQNIKAYFCVLKKHDGEKHYMSITTSLVYFNYFLQNKSERVYNVCNNLYNHPHVSITKTDIMININNKFSLLTDRYNILYNYFTNPTDTITNFIQNTNIKASDLAWIIETIKHNPSYIDAVNYNIEYFKTLASEIKKLLRFAGYLWISKQEFKSRVYSVIWDYVDKKISILKKKNQENRNNYLYSKCKEKNIHMITNSNICNNYIQKYINNEKEWRNIDRILAILRDYDILSKFTRYNIRKYESGVLTYDEPYRKLLKIDALNKVYYNFNPYDSNISLGDIQDFIARLKNEQDTYPELIGQCKTCYKENNNCECNICYTCDSPYNDINECDCLEKVRYPNQNDFRIKE